MNSTSIRAAIVSRRSYEKIFEALFWILLWFVASSLTIACIKTLTTNTSLRFPHPWLLIGFTNIGTWLLCNILQFCPKCFPETSNEQNIPWKFASLLGALQGIEVGIGAVIIQRISIALRTEIHMLTPVFIFFLGLAFGLEAVDARLFFSIVFVTIGGWIASYGAMTWEGLELVPFAIVAAILSTLRWVLTQKWLSAGGRAKPSPVIVALRMTPFTACVGFIVTLIVEPTAYKGLVSLPHPGEVAGLLLVISSGVCALVVSELRVVQLTSALLFGFLVPVHNVIIILLDATLRGAHVSRLNWSGILLCAIATGFYLTARARPKERLAAAAREPASYQSVLSAPASAEASQDRMC